MQKCLDNNNILMHSACIKGNSVVSENFIRTLKGKIHRNMTALDSCSYFDFLDKLVDEHNNNNHREK